MRPVSVRARRAAVAVACCVALLAGCTGPSAEPADAGPTDTGSTDTGPTPTWAMVFQNLPGALFSVWGTGADDIWTVGAAPPKQPELGPTVLHWDGKAWRQLPTGATGDLWWVTGGVGDSLWMAGSKGLILRYRKTTGQFEKHAAPDATQLFGIFPLADDDVWAVGGPPSCQPGQPCGVVWHFDGKAWSAAPGLDPNLAREATWFKVWARSANDVWVVGTGGKALHWDGKVWAAAATGTTRPLFTVHGNSKQVIAVGGYGTGEIIENLGSGFAPVAVAELDQVNGVYVPEKGPAFAAGLAGAVWQRLDAGWQRVEAAPEGVLDYHGVYVDPTGGVWAAGGQLLVPPFAAGQVAHFGTMNTWAAFPPAFALHWKEVATCRPSVEHDGVHVRVFANGDAQPAWTQNDFPYAAGAVLVKPEYADDKCANLLGYTAMRKEAAADGFSPGAWTWQKVAPTGVVQESGDLKKCSSCHFSSCKATDGVCTQP